MSGRRSMRWYAVHRCARARGASAGVTYAGMKCCEAQGRMFYAVNSSRNGSEAANQQRVWVW